MSFTGGKLPDHYFGILWSAAPDPTKVALVTGANKGIGKEIARGLARQGYTVLIGARKQELGEAAAQELAQDGQVHSQQLDVTDVKSVLAAAIALREKYGHLDVLVRSHEFALTLGDDACVITLSRLQLQPCIAVFLQLAWQLALDCSHAPRSPSSDCVHKCTHTLMPILCELSNPCLRNDYVTTTHHLALQCR